MTRVDDDNVNALGYLRAGFAFIGFACEEGATQFKEVREAVALCLDKDTLVDEYIGSYGVRVHSYYGLAQWMANGSMDELPEALTTYDYDTHRALSLLIQDGWTLNQAGQDYSPETDKVRCKLVGGQLMPLRINYAKVRGNGAAQLIEDRIAENLRSLGFEFNVAEMTFDEMLLHYYRAQDRTYNMFFLATDFTHVFDPYLTFSVDAKHQGALNTSGIWDEQLMQLAQSLRQTQPGDTQTYTDRWLALMKHYSDLLPAVPLYSNIYYDVFTKDLHDYAPNAHWSWTAALLYAYQGNELDLK